MNHIWSRRKFLAISSASSLSLLQADQPVEEQHSLDGRLFKTLKLGMVKGDSLSDRFKLAKQAGFNAVEINSPGAKVDSILEAIDTSGLPVDGSVCASHWKIRHSDPNPEIREQALKDLVTALRETKKVGGHTVLLVVGHGKDGTEEEVWERSVNNIEKAIPLAAELGISIAIENVWNHFCYDHGGPANQSADRFAKYIDEFSSPFVGMQFDIGNHWKYGNTGDWIRTLGKRIIKLDVKGFSREQSKFTKIGAGDIDFADIRKALIEINFHGWCAAEVGGGDLNRLQEISTNMDNAFQLKA